MNTRYVIERIAGKPDVRRIKDLKRNKYIKNHHGVDVFSDQDARIQAKALNDRWNSLTPNAELRGR